MNELWARSGTTRPQTEWSCAALAISANAARLSGIPTARNVANVPSVATHHAGSGAALQLARYAAPRPPGIADHPDPNLIVAIGGFVLGIASRRFKLLVTLIATECGRCFEELPAQLLRRAPRSGAQLSTL